MARLATVTVSGAAHVVPCCFATLENGAIVTAVDGKPKSTMALRRLDNIATNPEVSLVVDHYDDDWTQLWWVRADGIATILAAHADEPVYSLALDALAAKYAQYRTSRPTGAVISIAPTNWRSWSFA